jgi:S1-C subfamily serine protease
MWILLAVTGVVLTALAVAFLPRLASSWRDNPSRKVEDHQATPEHQVAQSPPEQPQGTAVSSKNPATTQPPAPSITGGQAGTQPSALSAQAIFTQASPAVVRVVSRDENFREVALGSGFFVTREGVLVTNYHVVKGAKFANVLLHTGATFFVDSILALDEASDLALLKVKGDNLSCLALAPTDKSLAVGDHVFAIGNPQGLTNSISEGIISGLRDEKGVPGVQTTAAISPGSSGGPLLDDKGCVVGVTTATLRGGQNLNFAVAAPKVKTLLAKAATSPSVALASRGGTPLEPSAAKDLETVWDAIQNGRWSEAGGILERLRNLDRNNPLIWFQTGVLHAALGNQDMALEAFNQMIALAPENPSGYLAAGEILRKEKKYNESLVAFSKAAELSPELSVCHTRIGMVLYELGRYQESEATLQKAIRFRPDDADAYRYLALACLKLGQKDKALRAVETLKLLNPPLAIEVQGAIKSDDLRRALAAKAEEGKRNREKWESFINPAAKEPLKVVYVIDRSGSMTDSIGFLKSALRRAIEQLHEQSEFHVIFYSSGPPLEMPTFGLVKATASNKQLATDFINGVIAQGETDPTKALQRAFACAPDLIYLLTDGEFDRALIDFVKRLNNSGTVKVNTIGYLYKTGEPVLRVIAQENGGEYFFVSENYLSDLSIHSEPVKAGETGVMPRRAPEVPPSPGGTKGTAKPPMDRESLLKRINALLQLARDQLLDARAPDDFEEALKPLKTAEDLLNESLVFSPLEMKTLSEHIHVARVEILTKKAAAARSRANKTAPN